MTPIEFANRYLTPPERYRFIENIGDTSNCPGFVLIDYIIDHNYKLHYFFDDFFQFETSQQGQRYWIDIKRRIRGLE